MAQAPREQALYRLMLVFQQSLNHAQAAEAEHELRSSESQPGFSILLLQLVANESFELNVRLAAAVFFKNFIRRKWVDENGRYLLGGQDVQAVKSEIIGLMISLPVVLQSQMGEAISTIADSDFPDEWPELVTELVGRLSDNIADNNSILTVMHAIFKRWRPLFRSDALFTEIKLVLDQFSVPFLQLFKKTDQQIEQVNDDKQGLAPLIQTVMLLVKLYYDLNCQDIPEFFEDNIEVLMGLLHKYLVYANPLLETDDDDETTPLDQVKTNIFEVLTIYTQRYEDVFGPLLPNFVQTTWNLLMTTGLQPKHDALVSRAMDFLAEVVQIQRQAELFGSEQVLDQIIKSIILPNVAIRGSDEELFEDDPIEYTRRDLEGSDSDTRRRAATDLLRQLTLKFDAKTTNVVMTYVRGFLDTHASNSGDWRAKNTAIYLFTAIAVKGNITNAGVYSTNLLVDVIDFFNKHIASILLEDQPTNNSSSDGQLSTSILKVDAIKYVNTFRNQLGKPILSTTFPLLCQHLLSPVYVVYTYASITIERLLSIRAEQGSTTPLFLQSDIAPVAPQLIKNLFSLIGKETTPEKLAENEFLMKCAMRILISCRESVSSIALETLNSLVFLIAEIARNPSNPRFSHYSFEAIGAIVRYCGPSVGPDQIQQAILPTFIRLIVSEITEFIPYTLQIISQSLHNYPIGSGLPDGYKALISPLLAVSIWEAKGNVPALVGLLQEILCHDSTIVTDGNTLISLFGIYQGLIASKARDSYGFDLFEDILINIPLAQIQPYLREAAVLLLQRLQSYRTEKFIVGLARFIYFISASEKPGLGPEFVSQMFDSTQQGIFGEILSQFVLPSTRKIQGARDRKIAAIGLTKTLTQNPQFITGHYSSKFLESLEILIELVGNELPLKLADEQFLDAEIDEMSFASTFSKLATTSIPQLDPVQNIKNVKEFVVSELEKLNDRTNGQLKQLLTGLPEPSQNKLIELGFK